MEPKDAILNSRFDELESSMRNIASIWLVAAAILINCGVFAYFKFEERMRMERASTTDELKKIHDALYRLNKVDEENCATMFAALKPPVTLLENGEDIFIQTERKLFRMILEKFLPNQ